MNTARVVVIDEDRDEALLLLSALGKAGIGAVYFDGDESHLPEHPCDGIRLVFLDLKLLDIPEPRNYIPFTVNVLERSVTIAPGITGIICWTKHIDDIALLMDELRNRNLEPAFVHSIEDKLRLRNTGDLQQILESIQTIVESRPGSRLLNLWEKSVHDSTSTTTEALWKLGVDDSDLLRVLAAVAVGAADEKIATPEDAISALYVGLSAVQADAIEELSSLQNANAPVATRLHEAVGRLRQNGLNPEERARLNRAMLITQSSRPQPGNVYVARGWQRPDQFPFNLSGAEARALVREFFPDRRSDDVFVTAIADSSVPCLVELTPACDFAQGKCSDARLLGGLLIKSPGDEERERSRSIPAGARLFAKEVEFIWIENQAHGLSGSYRLIVNARLLKTLTFVELKNHSPSFRIRHSVVTDIRAWLGSHAARPGYLAIH